MNSLGTGLAWCVVHVTLLTLATAALYLLLQRFRSGVSGGLLLSCMLLIPLLTIAAVMPVMPRWSWLQRAEETAAESGTLVDPVKSADMPRSPAAHSELAGVAPTDETNSWATTWGEFRVAFVDELAQPATVAGEVRTWPNWFVFVLAALTIMAVLRLIGGWLLVRTFYGVGLQVEDERLDHVTSHLCTALNISRAIQIREAERLGAPATVGWRRPLILLPTNWREWSDEQLQVVMAHELAHVARSDFAAWSIAQLGLALHIYHPLVHWLANRLRLEQEIAADAMAAALVGGEKKYLGVLARTALGQSPRSVTWLARSFFPYEGTFIRRIKMLRKPRVILSTAPARMLRTLLVICLIFTACVISGLRLGSSPVSATERPSTTGATATADSPSRETLKLTYVPADAFAVLAVRPADLLANPQMANMVPLINEINNVGADIGFKVESLAQVTIVFRLVYLNGRPLPSPAILIESNEPIANEKLRRKMDLGDKRKTLNGTVYYTRTGRRAMNPALAILNESTVLYSADEGTLTAALTAGPNPSTSGKWTTPWKTVEKSDFGMFADLSIFGALIDEQMSGADTAMMLTLSPIWKDADHYVIGFNVSDRATACLTAQCQDADKAKRLGDTLQAVVTLAKNQLVAVRENVTKRPMRPDESIMAHSLLGMAGKMLESIELTSEGTQVKATLEMPAEATVATIAALVPAIKAAREAAYRAQAANNLKMIMLAFHNYHDVYKHFPGSVNIRKPGEPPHSWRVAILPFIEQTDLYEQYHFDEPWDSPSNKKLIAKMPKVLRHPTTPAGATSSDYYVFVGGGALFEHGEQTKIRDIRDGTSNTIAVVEAKRDFPWTKPEDIPFDPDAALPEIGGIRASGLNAGLADGSVKFFADSVDRELLKKMVTCAGGETIKWDR